MQPEGSLTCPQQRATGTCPVHILQAWFFKISSNIILCLPFRFSDHKSVCISQRPMRATRPANLTFLHFTIHIMFCEEYKLYSFLHPAVTFSFLGPNILLSHLLQTSSLMFFL